MTVAQHINTAGMLVRVTVGAALDRFNITGTAATAEQIPARVERITTQWLTAVLCAHIPGAAVVDHSVIGGSDGTSSRRAIRVHHNPAGEAAGLPERLFAKSSASLSSRLLLGITGITLGEAIFFNELRPRVQLRGPRAYFAAADPRTARSIVLMDDLAAYGWAFPDPMHDHIDEHDTRAMAEQIATYHAAFWNGRTAPVALASLPSTLQFQQRLNQRAACARQFQVGLDRSRALLPDGLWQRRAELWPAFMHSLQLNTEGAQTLLHQDLHQGNWLRDPDRKIGLYDWQCVARGGWALDLAYALIATLDPADRHAWQHDIVHHYLATLIDHGITAPAFKDAWLDVSRQTLHAFVFGVFTNGQPRFAPELQPRDYTLRSIERIAQAVHELNTLDALRTS
jgi:hypothetical protein